MTSYVSVDLRLLVSSRANHLCEYCLVHERDTYLGCQVDHIISEKHQGLTVAANLAFACAFCNRAKGSDIGSLVLSTGQFTRFFNPRCDQWAEHFILLEAAIQPLTAIGEATVSILQFNEPDRLLERESLLRLGRYPSREAVALLGTKPQ
jgi:hypothetical protein